MEQVKTFFAYIDDKEDAKKLGKKINEWFLANQIIQVTQRFQTETAEGTLITIFYKEGLALS